MPTAEPSVRSASALKQRRLVSESSALGAGTVLAQRYRLEEPLSKGDPIQGRLWRALDTLAGDTPLVIRQVQSSESRQRFQQIWPRLQSLLHPQLPRCGELLESHDSLWTVRDWQEGDTYSLILRQRSERQMVFGAGEVLLLLRQTLPLLAVINGRGLVHGDVNPRNLLRRHSDGLPVLLDFGLVQIPGEAPLAGATPGYAPRAQGRSEPCAPWMDLHGLGVTALVLLSGRTPETLIAPDGAGWSWPEQLELEPEFRAVLERLLLEDKESRFAEAAQVLAALEPLAMPESTGPIARADRTVVLAPRAVGRPAPDLPSLSSPADPVPAADPTSLRRSRAEAREQGAEGRLWPVVLALALSALAGTAIGWFVLTRGASRDTAPSTSRDVVGRSQGISLPPAEVDERQQLLSRLRALQVDRTWFLKLVDSSLLARFPERGGRLPSDSLEDAPLRRVWNDLAEEWLARIEQLPPGMRSRLGQLKETDWRKQRQDLVSQGVNGTVVEQLVSAGARDLLPGDVQGRRPEEPYRQLWYAAAIQSLSEVTIENVTAQSGTATNLSLRVPSGGARLISVTVPAGHDLVLGINGTPLMQMTIFGAQGQVEKQRGPLRVVTLPAAVGSPVQALVTNEGVSAGLLTLSCRADRARRTPLPAIDPDPFPDPATEAPSTPSAMDAQPQPQPDLPSEPSVRPSTEDPSSARRPPVAAPGENDFDPMD